MSARDPLRGSGMACLFSPPRALKPRCAAVLLLPVKTDTPVKKGLVKE